MEKVVRDGMVAVLVSPGYGAGWSTWAHHTGDDLVHPCLFDPEIVEWVERGKEDPEPDFEAKYGEYFYTGGAGDLVVRWVPVGTRFYIKEYDGFESLITESDQQWIIA